MNILEARRRLLDGEIKKRTAEGENISVRSVSRMRPALTLYGKSEQETTTGAQLLKDTYLDNVTGAKDVFNSDGEIIIPQGISTNKEYNIHFSDISDILTQMQDDDAIYICIRLIKKINQSEFNYQIAFKNAENINIIDTFNDNIKQTTYSTLKNSRRIQCYFYNNNQSVDISGNVFQMIISRDENCIYEPYTGGQPSPSPDYPQEIESVGDDGDIRVDVYGGNLFDPNYQHNFIDLGHLWGGTRTIVGKNVLDWTTFPNDSGITRPFYLYPILPNTEYVITVSNTGTQANWYIGIADSNGIGTRDIILFDNKEQTSFITEENETYLVLNLTNSFECMLNIGSIALPYEPYKQPQSLTISTSNGLPGIPVPSGGNYTDESGQQWISDEIDFKRGKYVKRVGKYIPTGNESISGPTTRDRVDQYVIAVETGVAQNSINFGLSNKFKCENRVAVNTFTVTGQFIYFRFAEGTQTPESTREVLNGCEFWYILNTPIETPLSPSELAAYAALRTYSPTTVVSNDAGAWMKLGYKTKKSLEVTD